MNIKKHFAKKSTNEYIKLACNVKLNKFLNKLAKNIKFIDSMKTMDLRLDKSNMRTTTFLDKSNMSLSLLNDMGVIIPAPNTMKSNATAS